MICSQVRIEAIQTVQLLLEHDDASTMTHSSLFLPALVSRRLCDMSAIFRRTALILPLPATRVYVYAPD